MLSNALETSGVDSGASKSGASTFVVNSEILIPKAVADSSVTVELVHDEIQGGIP